MTKVNASNRLQRGWQEIRPLLVMVLVLFSIRSSVADWNDVPSGSMQPTILVGDRIFVNKLAYDLKVPFTTWHLAEWAAPLRGDIVVMNSPLDGTRLVKRTVGLPGDIVELRDNRLIINGQPVDYTPLDTAIVGQVSGDKRQHSRFATEHLPVQSHAVMSTPGVPAARDFGPFQVPTGQYFVMGDNRDNSLDSRYFGAVDRRQILGKATAVAFSLDRDHQWRPRIDRFCRRLDAPLHRR